MTQADRPDRQPLFCCNSFRRAVQHQVRFPAPFVQGLDLPPGDWADAGPQRLGGGFLGGKADGQRFGPSPAFEHLQFRENPFQEAFAMPVKRCLDARNFDDVDTGFEDHIHRSNEFIRYPLGS